MNHPLLSNAVSAIQLGIEDYQSPEPNRRLSAVRNIAAGVLLMFKEKLRALSPADSDEVLLKERIQPIRNATGTLSFVGSGRKTVDVQQIKSRFRSLTVTADWERFDDLIGVRNDLEHYYSLASEARVQEVLSDAFLVLRDFITVELNQEPVALLGEATWRVLLDESAMYQSELKRCRQSIDQIAWPSTDLAEISNHLRCMHCRAELIKPVDPLAEPLTSIKFVCTACGQDGLLEELVEAAVTDAYEGDIYVAMTDGGDPPIAECHECGRFTFHPDTGQCLLCQAGLTHTRCAICAEELGPDEQRFRGLCSYHHWVSEKDD